MEKARKYSFCAIWNAPFHIDAEVPKGGVRKFGLLPWPSLARKPHLFQKIQL